MDLSRQPTPSLRLASIFGSGMVLPRDIPLVISGWADPGVQVNATLAGMSSVALAAANGAFLLQFAQLPAGGPHSLIVRCAGSVVELSDVLVGDVWLSSGQSNMEWKASDAECADAELSDADYDHIRLLNCPKQHSTSPQREIAARWCRASRETVSEFSAIGFFVSRSLHQALEIPIGVIDATWGATTAEVWTPIDALRAEPVLSPLAREFDSAAQGMLYAPGPYSDGVNLGELRGWAFDVEEGPWSDIYLPQPWVSAGLYHNGAVWFRRTIELSVEQAAAPTRLSLGPCADADHTYVNGTLVGSIGLDTEQSWTIPRVYEVPGGLLRPGSNIIATRVFSQWGTGGVCGTADSMCILLGDQAISIAGTWRCLAETQLPLRFPSPAPFAPSTVYNGMIHPLTALPVRGVLWYQGESNCDRADQYRSLLPAMILAWRNAWNAELPFYVVQLANRQTPPTYPGESAWAELREAQDFVQHALPGVFMISAIDVGGADDIHPRDKRSVADRLVNAVLATNYNMNVPWRHPSFNEAVFNPDGSVRILLNDSLGLHVRGGRIQGFSVAADDRRWHWAEASLEVDPVDNCSYHVVVAASNVRHPVAVRYAWATNPISSLYNAHGLPLLPFRTDDWPGISVGRLSNCVEALPIGNV